MNGDIIKPFPSKPYCYDGVGTVEVVNNCGKVHAVCQTVLPGDEAMLIPTEVQSSAVIAVPGIDYWASTAAHYVSNISCPEAQSLTMLPSIIIFLA